MSYAVHSSSTSDLTAGSLARGLGWFSLALGATEVLAPQVVTRALGMQGRETLIRAYGVREIASGIGILSSRNPAPWVWSRVAGDALDLATLSAGFTRHNRHKEAVGIAMVAVAGIAALDMLCGQALTQEGQAMELRFPVRDYSDRTGFPRPPADMRGAASDFQVPKEFRSPEAMRPWTDAAE
jgi:hypothetical protein